MRGSPEFSAISRSKASSARTSPTMRRSGRIRSASVTSRRSRTSPVPSRLDCRHCSATQSGSGTLTSKTSSHVTTRSRAGIAAVRQLSNVVLPDWVPPATSTLSPAWTVASRKRATCTVIVPKPTSSSSDEARTTNLRMFTAQPSSTGSGGTGRSVLQPLPGQGRRARLLQRRRRIPLIGRSAVSGKSGWRGVVNSRLTRGTLSA